EDGAVLARGATDHMGEGLRVGDYAALVALLNEGMAMVARDVAVAMGGLVATAPPDGGPGGDTRQ
ncbi:MAG TPA: hypothetical protein VMK65_13400, partial [Longimicrobiales bacterium]|nr:hypothetical protein [Longimicrobiales bacterium]